MARIRTYERSVQTPDAQLKQTAVPLNATAEAGVRLGQSISGFADVLHKNEVQKDINSSHLALSEIRNNFTNRIQEETQTGTLSDDSIKKMQADYQEEINKITGSLQTSDGKDYLDKNSFDLGSDLIRSAGMAKAQLAGQMAVEQLQQANNLNGNTLQKTPSEFQSVLVSSLQAIDAQVAGGNLDFAAAEKIKRVTTESLAENSVKGWIDINRPFAKQSLTRGDYDKFLRPEDKATLLNHIDALDRADVAKKKSIEELKFKNPWDFLKEKGVSAKAVDFTNQKSIVERQMFIKANEKQFGYLDQEIPFLTPSETRDFTRVLKQQDAASTASMLRTMSSNTPPELYSRISKQIFEESPAHGIAMSIASEDTGTAEKIIAGKVLLSDTTKGGIDSKSIITSSSKEVSEEFDAFLGNSISDPNLRIKLKDAAYSHYIKSKFDEGDDLQTLDSKEFKKSLELVMGPVGQVNDQKIVSFRDAAGKFIDVDDLENGFENLNPDIINRAQGDVPRLLNGTELDMKKSKGRITPVPVANAKYLLKRDGEILLDKKGQPFELDMKKYMEIYSKEKPKGFFKRLFE